MPTHAQQAITACGGEATAISGTLNFSIGQVDFIMQDSKGNTICEGVQQPYGAMQTMLTPVNVAWVKIYPNPVTTTLTVNITGSITANYNLIIYNSVGQAVAAKQVSRFKTISFFEWDVKNLTPGIYLLKVAGLNINAIPFVKL